GLPPLDDPGAAAPRRLRERRGGGDGVAVAGLRLVSGGDQVLGEELGLEPAELVRPYEADVDPHFALESDVPLEAPPVPLAHADKDAGLDDAARAADPVFPLLEDAETLERHPSGDLVGVVLAHDRGRAAGRSGGEGALLEEHHASDSSLGELKRDTRAVGAPA